MAEDKGPARDLRHSEAPAQEADRADTVTHWARSEAALGRGSGLPWRPPGAPS